MKEKNFRKAYLNFSILLVLIMTLVSCEKQQDDFYPDNQNLTLIDKLENTINKDDLFSNFYHKHKINIDWDVFKIYKNNNKLLYEFNVSPKESFANDLPSIFSQSSSYSVLAFESDNRIIIHLIEYRPYAYSYKTTNSLFDLNSFSGIVKYFDESGDITNSQIYKQGELLKTDQEGYISQPTKKDKSKDKSNFLNKAEPCDTTTSPGLLTVTETTHHYIDWHRGVVNTAGQIELTFVRSEYVGSTTKTYTYEYFSCDTPHTGDEIYKSEYERLQQIIDDKPCENDPVMNPEIASSGVSGKKGGTFGCTRTANTTCGGVYGKKNHNGLDIKANVNEKAFAMYSGTISSIRNTFSPGQYKKDSYGNFVVITTVINGVTRNIKYNHLNSVSVTNGQKINVGDTIGLTGNTGNANPPEGNVIPHIHLQVFNSNWSQTLDPEAFLQTKFDSNANSISNNCI